MIVSWLFLSFFVFIESVSVLLKGCFLVNLLIVSSVPGRFWSLSRVFPECLFSFYRLLPECFWSKPCFSPGYFLELFLSAANFFGVSLPKQNLFSLTHLANLAHFDLAYSKQLVKKEPALPEFLHTKIKVYTDLNFFDEVHGDFVQKTHCQVVALKPVLDVLRVGFHQKYGYLLIPFR